MKHLLTRLSQLCCGLTGHDRMKHFDYLRVSMKCTHCGHETPGWSMR